MKTKMIAFYLPQFHAIPENDEWWGKGFTEWNSVKSAEQYFEGQYQPKVPLNNNYYNLLDLDALKWQIELAKKYGLYAFCFYHYWFDGKLLLEKPIENYRKLEDRIPYCFCWASEPWRRTWYGMNNEILIDQNYGNKDTWAKHFEYMSKYFMDEKYIKVDNKPLFVIYSTSKIPNCNDMILFWDKECKSLGFDGIYIVEEKNSYQSHSHCEDSSAILEFEPAYTMKYGITTLERGIKKAYRKCSSLFNKHELNIFDYNYVWNNIHNRKRDNSGKQLFLGAFVNWDNTPRKGRYGTVMKNATPETFEKNLKKQISLAKEIKSEYIFINAWNEWSEGAFMEPDEKYKYGFLEAMRNAVFEE